MGRSTTARSLTVRLEPRLYTAATELARKRSVSLNTLVHESLADAVREEEDRELKEAFERFGSDRDTDVSYADPAQAELALGVTYDA